MTIRVFISFDFDNDHNYRNLLTAFSKNPVNDIKFEDSTPGEIDTKDISRVKAVLTTKIRDATHTLVLIGKHANAKHEDAEEIGARNWQWWEIEKSEEEGKKLVGVKIESTNESPEPLLRAGAKWANSFTVEAITKALRESK